MIPLHGVQRQPLHLEQLAPIGRCLDGPPDGPLHVTGAAWAYDYRGLSADKSTPWHWTLMRAALLALDAQRGKRPLFAAYGMSPGMARLLLCSIRELNVKRKTHDILSTIPGYIEAGYDALNAGELRPLAYWEPSNTLVALWPLPMDTRPGPFALDAGNLLRFACYPEPDHEQGVALDLAGPDYMRVPAEPEGRLKPEGLDYDNRWAVIVGPEPAGAA